MVRVTHADQISLKRCEGSYGVLMESGAGASNTSAMLCWSNALLRSAPYNALVAKVYHV